MQTVIFRTYDATSTHRLGRIPSRSDLVFCTNLRRFKIHGEQSFHFVALRGFATLHATTTVVPGQGDLMELVSTNRSALPVTPQLLASLDVQTKIMMTKYVHQLSVSCLKRWRLRHHYAWPIAEATERF